MRNLENAIRRVQEHKGKLSKSIVCSTAKQTLNQYARGWLKPTPETQALIDRQGLIDVLEKPLLNRRLDDALTAQGIEWLNRFLFTASGKQRTTKALRRTPSAVFDIVSKFSHFTFAGFETESRGYCSEYLPSWRVHAKDGSSFVYTYNGGRFNPDGGFEVFGVVQPIGKRVA